MLLMATCSKEPSFSSASESSWLCLEDYRSRSRSMSLLLRWWMVLRPERKYYVLCLSMGLESVS